MVKVSQIKVPVVDVIKASGGKGIKTALLQRQRKGLYCRLFPKSWEYKRKK